MGVAKISIEELKNAIAACFSFSAVAKQLGIAYGGGNVTRLKEKAKKHNIDFLHFTGQLWSKGKTALEDDRVRNGGRDASRIFVKNSNASPTYVRSLVIKRSLLPYKCKLCGHSGDWNGKKLVLQLDHINGDRKDHRLTNLRWLCPNCHTQTDTFTSKNGKDTRKKISDKELLSALNGSSNIYQALKKVGLVNGRNYARAKKLLERHG